MKHKPVEGDKKSFHETGIMGDVYNSIKRAQAALDEDPFTGTGTSLVERDIQKKLEQYERNGQLPADSGMDRSLLSACDPASSVDGCFGSVASNIKSAAQKFMEQQDSLRSIANDAIGKNLLMSACDPVSSVDGCSVSVASEIKSAAQKFMEQQDSLGSITNDAIGKNLLMSACDPVSSVDACFGSVGSDFKSAAQKFMERNEFMSSLAERALNGYSTRSGDHLLKDLDSLEGSLAAKLDSGGVFDRYTIPIAPLRSYQEEPVTPPVFDFRRCIAHEHRDEDAEPRKERPLIKKKNCPEEVYTPNEDQIRERLIIALNTYLDDHKKIVQQKIDKLPSNLTEESRKEYDSLMSDYQYPIDESAKIETQDLLLLPEDELRQRLVENPLIRTYIFMGLQTILRERKQSYNDPDFIEAQRRKVAYNFNSYYLDEDTDYLLSYETMRWLERERNDGIVIASTNEQTENIASAIRKPGRKVKLTMDVFKQKIYPEMKKRFPDSKHVSGKKAYCTEIGEKYGVSEKTIRDKFDECNLGE